MNKTHKHLRELKEFQNGYKKTIIIHPIHIDIYTITPVKKKMPKISNAAWPTFGTQISNEKKRKKDFHEHRGQTIDNSATLLPFKRTRLRVNGSIER